MKQQRIILGWLVLIAIVAILLMVFGGFNEAINFQ
jgi:hypothetical protein